MKSGNYSTKTEICLLFLDLFLLKLWYISIFPNKLDISPTKRKELFPVLCRKFFRLYLWKYLGPICILSCTAIFGKISENFFTVYPSARSLFFRFYQVITEGPDQRTQDSKTLKSIVKKSQDMAILKAANFFL